MTKLKLSDITNILVSDYPYASIVDYLRFMHRFGRGTKVLSTDPEMSEALQSDIGSTTSLKLAKLYRLGLMRREFPAAPRKKKDIVGGRKPYLYYIPK